MVMFFATNASSALSGDTKIATNTSGATRVLKYATNASGSNWCHLIQIEIEIEIANGTRKEVVIHSNWPLASRSMQRHPN